MSRPLVAVAPDRRLAVTVSQGDGPVVLLAHGVGSSAQFVREAFEVPLVEAGWRLASVDLRGHGDSDAGPLPGDHDLDVHAADLAVVAARVRASVVGGVSIGGMAAIRSVTLGLAARAVVAVIPGWSGRAEIGVGPHAAVADEVRRLGVAGMLARLETDEGMPSWIREVVLRDYRRHDPDSLAAALVGLDGGDAPALAEVAAIGMPLAVVGWRDDPGHPWEVAQQWTEAAPASHLEETSIDQMQDDRTSFGRAVVRALEALDVTAG